MTDIFRKLFTGVVANLLIILAALINLIEKGFETP